MKDARLNADRVTRLLLNIISRMDEGSPEEPASAIDQAI